MIIYAFQVYWFISFLVLLFFVFWLGKLTGNGVFGILIDSRGRYSLTNFQVVLWTLVILSSLVGLFILQDFDLNKLQIPPQLLMLMGISASSAVLSTGVKGIKDAPGSQAKVSRVSNPQFVQIWQEEEGALADKTISISKYQNFMFTLIALGFFITAASKSGILPTLPDNLVWLMGISHAGYVAAKVPDKQ